MSSQPPVAGNERKREMGTHTLTAANEGQKDEFSTQLPNIAEETRHYKEAFKRKAVFCSCDNPRGPIQVKKGGIEATFFVRWLFSKGYSFQEDKCTQRANRKIKKNYFGDSPLPSLISSQRWLNLSQHMTYKHNPRRKCHE